MNKKILYVLTAIIFISVILRFWQLGKIPISPDWDEVALGYSAYSILETGRDEYGKFLPVVLRSFDDYKPALYAYLVIPSLLFFDLTVFAVRFPSAFLGVLTVLASFFLIRELFKDYKYKEEVSLLAAFLFAISPWHIQFSRVAFESNVGLAFNVFAVLFFVLGLRKKSFLILSSICGALAIYTYQSEKVFTPLIFLLLILIFFKQFIQIPRKYLIAFFIAGVIVVFPMIVNLVSDKNALMRAKGTSIFSAQTELLKDNINKLEDDRTNNDKIGLILDNRRGVYLSSIVGGYLSHYDFNWLFIKGDIDRHHAPKMGLMYLWELPFLLIGIYTLLFGAFNKKAKFLIFGWFLLAPIPASITTGVPHAVRTLNFLPMFQVLTAIGLITAYSAISNLKYKKIKYWKGIVICYGLFSLFNFSYYLNQYFVQQNYFNAQQWQFGWDETVKSVNDNQEKYKKIIVSDKEPLDRAYMFFAFYLKYPPEEYQKFNINGSGGFAEVHKYGKFEFRPINWEKDSLEENTLLVGNRNEFPLSGGFRVKKEVKNPDGTTAIMVVGK